MNKVWSSFLLYQQNLITLFLLDSPLYQMTGKFSLSSSGVTISSLFYVEKFLWLSSFTYESNFKRPLPIGFDCTHKITNSF